MGILRADRITGLGGANAIKGSVFFPHDGTATPTSGALQVQNVNDALTFGTGDFTIEFWFYTNRIGVTQHLYDGRGTGAGTNTAVLIQISDSNNIRFFTTNAYRITGSSTLKANTWYHVALTRTGSTHTLYVDGSSDGTWSGNSGSYTGPTNNRSAIGSDDNGAGAYGLNGFISNLRVSKELVYSAAFTVPTAELAPTPNTTLLCCQSPGDAQASFGDCILTAFPKSINSQGPVASRFTPNTPVGFSTTSDVGSQYGSTFDGFGNFATSSYMVPPGGNSRERNRGRAVFGGGESPTADNVMEYLNIQSGGRTIDFGDHSANTPNGDAVASSTRGVFTVHNSPANSNALEFITIANTGNSQDFGDQTTGGVSQEAAASNSTRGLFAGGIFPGSTVHDTTEYITIATLGNAVDFGNLIASVTSNTGVADATRALFAGGIGPSSPFPTVNRIEYFTIANTGNATDFGDLTFSARYPSSAGDSTRGVFMGGATPSATNTMCFVTIQTTGDATDFGDLVTASHDAAATSDSVRAIMGAGGTPSNTNTIEKITIQTTGNAVDHGDLSRQVSQLGACSDSHGGIS